MTFLFSEKMCFRILCKLSARQMIYMTCQELSSHKKKNKKKQKQETW